MAETSYASCGDLSLAYQVFGDGPVELVFAGSFVSHVELFWTLPEFQAFMEQLSTFCRVLLFDKAGLGLSDPVPQVRTLDDRAAEIEAVMDAVGFGKAVLFGVSEGGPAAMVFAATRPKRTRALILTGTGSYTGYAGWDDVERDPAELRARLVPELGEDYTPSTEQIARWQEFARAARSAWGSGEALRCLLPSVRPIRQLGVLERMSASPGMARATMEAVFRIDLRPILPTITAPTLVSMPATKSFRCRAAGTSPTTPWRAVPRGRRYGPRALAHRSRQVHHRDRGVPHRQPRGAVAVTSRPAHRATWAPVLQAFGNPERLLITLWLAGTISSVRDLEYVTGLSQSLVSYHLRALREAGLVTATAHGRANLYQLAHPDLDKLALLVGNLDARTFPAARGPDAPPVTAGPTPTRR